MKPKRKTLKMPGWTVLIFVCQTRYIGCLSLSVDHKNINGHTYNRIYIVRVMKSGETCDPRNSSGRYNLYEYATSMVKLSNRKLLRKVTNECETLWIPMPYFCVGKQQFERQRKRGDNKRQEEQKMFRILNSIHEKELAVEIWANTWPCHLWAYASKTNEEHERERVRVCLFG